MTASPGSADIFEAIRNGSIDAVLIGITDFNGQMIGKRCSAKYFLDHHSAGFGLCDLMLAQDIAMAQVEGATDAGSETGYVNIVIRPDLTTLTRPSWLNGTALVLADSFRPDGNPLARAPRSILRQQFDVIQAAGLRATFASELEFYLFEGDFAEATARGIVPRPVTRFDCDGHIQALDQHDDLWREMTRALESVGVAVEYIKFEGGMGQAEIVTAPGDPLASADRHILQKLAVKAVAKRHGLSASFMAKPMTEEAGSSGHVHMSIAARTQPEGEDAGALLPKFLAGLIENGKALTLLVAPTVNAYKRLATGMLAPRSIGWGRDDRTAAFRLIGAGSSARVECRIGGADLNPYIAYAGLLAAGLDGIDKERELGPPGEGHALPQSLADAETAFSASELFRTCFGAEVAGHLAAHARHEVRRSMTATTDWEIARYLERI